MPWAWATAPTPRPSCIPSPPRKTGTCPGRTWSPCALYAAGTTLRGNPADYTVANLSSGATLVRDDANFGRNGSRTVAALNNVAFGDGSVGLVDVTGNAGTMARLYQAAFTRAPDLAGLQNYVSLLDQGTIGLPAIADGFLTSPEYQRAYGAQDTTTFVNQLYQNVLESVHDHVEL